MAEEAQMVKAIKLFYEKGQNALTYARQLVKQEKVEFEPLQNALNYFMDNWEDVLHPALVSLACEAVGGHSESTVQVSAALVLLAGAADVHDDIIDHSEMKGSKLTVYGKYGLDVAILAGDILLLKGTYVLYDACQKLPKNKMEDVLQIVRESFLEVSAAEAKETSFRGKLDVSEQEYFEIIRHKVAAGEASTRIGAIWGNGSEAEVEKMGQFGRTFSILMTLRDEFADMFEPDEMKNRFESECLPYPVLLTFQEEEKKKTILQLLNKELTEEVIENILDIVMVSPRVDALREKIDQMITQENRNIAEMRQKETLIQLLDAMTQGIKK
ncbi:MAG: polyprenyl synthetase family protein [Candidatus Bathyarchaeia archaeon]|jgi:geranylgeranyl pyrophosphate synthase